MRPPTSKQISQFPKTSLSHRYSALSKYWHCLSVLANHVDCLTFLLIVSGVTYCTKLKLLQVALLPALHTRDILYKMSKIFFPVTQLCTLQKYCKWMFFVQQQRHVRRNGLLYIGDFKHNWAGVWLGRAGKITQKRPSRIGLPILYFVRFGKAV
jgi:hypothetical protein